MNLVCPLSMILATLLFGQRSLDQPLKFLLSAEKSTYRVFEPVELKIEITNTTERPISGVFSCLNFDSHELKVYYRKKAKNSKGIAARESRLLRAQVILHKLNPWNRGSK